MHSENFASKYMDRSKLHARRPRLRAPCSRERCTLAGGDGQIAQGAALPSHVRFRAGLMEELPSCTVPSRR